MPPRKIPTPRRTAIRKLNESDVQNIVGIIDGWPSQSMTWVALVDQVTAVLGHTWTRQALEKHEAIKAAYQRVRDDRRPGGKRQPTDPAEVLLTRRVEGLKQEVEQLRRQVAGYEERFIRYQYNAYAQGMTPQELERPLPPIDRRRSDI